MRAVDDSYGNSRSLRAARCSCSSGSLRAARCSCSSGSLHAVPCLCLAHAFFTALSLILCFTASLAMRVRTDSSRFAGQI